MATNLERGSPKIPANFLFQDFQPDSDPITPGIMLDCSNIYSTSKGFRSYPSLVVHSLNGLTGDCRGNWVGYIGPTQVLVAADHNQLYKFNFSTANFTSEGLSLSSTNNRWSIDSYGRDIIAVNGIDTPRVSINNAPFTVLGGSPPIASLVCATDFSVFLIQPDSNTWWSSLSDTIWTPAIATQTVTGHLDSTDGAIVAAHKLRAGIALYKLKAFHFGTFVGPPFYWQFNTVSEQVGAPGQEAIANLGDAHYWPGTDNFYFFDGYSLNVIPNNLKDWFFDTMDGDNADKIAARWDQRRSLIFWHFPSINANPTGSLDSWICYNTRTGRWTARTVQEYIELPIFSPVKVGGLTYGTFAARYATYGDIPDRLYGDDRPQNQNLSGVFGTNHKIQFYNGTPGASFITTHDFGEGHNMYCISRLRPRFSLPYYPTTAVVSVMKQYTPGRADAPVALSRPISTDGWFNLMSTARLQRFKIDLTGDYEVVSLEAMVDYAGER